MPDTDEAEAVAPQPAAAAGEDGSTARRGGNTARKEAVEEAKEQLAFGEPAADADAERLTGNERGDAASADDALSPDSTATADSTKQEATANDELIAESSQPAAAAQAAEAIESVATAEQPLTSGAQQSDAADIVATSLSIRVGSPGDTETVAVDTASKPAKGKKSTSKAKPAKPAKTPTAVAATPGKTLTASKSPRPPSTSTSAATTARKATTQPPLSVAIDSTSQPASARVAAGLFVPSPAARTSRSPRASITSNLPSPSKQRSVEETLAYWPLPTPREAGQALSPLFHLVLEGRADGVLAHIASIPIHERLEAVNCYDGSGNSPLMYALQDGRQAVLELLLDYGCDVNGANERRNSALHLAVHHQWKRCVSTLIEYGCNIKSENWEHQQPHQMLKAAERQQAVLTQLNAAHEATQAKIAAKQLLVVEREVRCYYRAMFDLLDADGLGALSWFRVKQLMETVLAEREAQRLADNPPTVVRHTAAEREKAREKEKEAGGGEAGGGGGAAAEVDWVGRWFGELDADHNGVLSFNEFLSAVLAWRAELEKDSKKAGKGKGKGKGTKKKK